jgi:hypothetical protein
LDTRTPNAPTAVRIQARVVIEPSGEVATVTMEDASPGYPNLGNCVAGLVRSMKFRRASTRTTVNIPFVFAARKPVQSDCSG